MISFSNIQITEGTVTEPVTVEEIKEWISGLDGVNDFDNLLSSMNTAARQDIENYLNVKLVESTVTSYVDSSKDEDEIFVLPYSLNLPATLTTINKIVRGETASAMAVNIDYYLNGTLAFTYYGRYQLEYDIPATSNETLKEAIKMLVAYRFANRGDNEKQMGLPEDVVSKIYPYKKTWL